MTTYLNGKELPIHELQLGDVVQLFDEAFGTAIVKQVKNGQVHFFRPYGTHESFSYTGGVLCYVGIEEFSRAQSDTSTVRVWRRSDFCAKG